MHQLFNLIKPVSIFIISGGCFIIQVHWPLYIMHIIIVVWHIGRAHANRRNWFRVQYPAPVGPLINDFKIQVRLSNLVRSITEKFDLRNPMARRVDTALEHVASSLR